MRKAFTLMEINLAIMIMAGGILSVLGLYSLGYRENRQSRDDVATAAYAEAIVSPLVIALSSTNLTWETFNKLDEYPEGGWGDYINNYGQVDGNPNSKAKQVFDEVLNKLNVPSFNATWIDPKVYKLEAAGLVVQHKGKGDGNSNRPIVRIGFRAARNRSELLSMPLYYTEVAFQGHMNEEEANGK